MTSEDNEQWVTITEARKVINESALHKVTIVKLSRLASQGRLQSKKNPFDDRQNLLNLDEVKRYFGITEDTQKS